MGKVSNRSLATHRSRGRNTDVSIHNAGVDGTQPQTLHIPADDLQTADRSFNTPVGNEPHQGYQNVDRVRNPCIKEREQDAGYIEHRRNLALEVAIDRPRQRGFAAFACG
jgi:hypothetical protein